MMPPDTRLTVRRIAIGDLLVTECKVRYASMVMTYVEQLLAFPHHDAGYIRVVPSSTHAGLFVIEDGHHRYCAAIIAGRTDMLCIVVERPPEEEGKP